MPGMPIVGHGIDIVAVERLRRLAEDHGQRFLDRCFTPAEVDYCRGRPKRYYEHLAGRFACKEAVMKVLGTGMRRGVAFTDIEIRKQVTGAPLLALSGAAATVAAELGITRWHISLSHVETHATASAIGECV